jgi:L-ribulose-5-phosphate 3-epimerase
MKVNRRRFIETGSAAFAAVTLTTLCVEAVRAELKIGMCDWNLGKPCDPAGIPKARQAGLQGIQVSVSIGAEQLPFRQPEFLEKYRKLGREHGVTFNSVAAGVLNSIPLKSEPQAGVFVIEALEVAAGLGAGNILLAFFADGDLRVQNAEGQFNNLSQGKFKSYELDRAGVKRVVDVLRLVVPRAEKLGVVIGIENTLSAEQSLDLLQQVGSPLVQVYYDVGNATEYGYDVPSEIRMLGKERICEIHLKDWKTPLLGTASGAVDFPAAARACKDIEYDGWYVLETSGREGHFLEDTRANIAFAGELFG